jgi:hypothetical protein
MSNNLVLILYIIASLMIIFGTLTWGSHVPLSREELYGFDSWRLVFVGSDGANDQAETIHPCSGSHGGKRYCRCRPTCRTGCLLIRPAGVELCSPVSGRSGASTSLTLEDLSGPCPYMTAKKVSRICNTLRLQELWLTMTIRAVSSDVIFLD